MSILFESFISETRQVHFFKLSENKKKLSTFNITVDFCLEKIYSVSQYLLKTNNACI